MKLAALVVITIAAIGTSARVDQPGAFTLGIGVGAPGLLLGGKFIADAASRSTGPAPSWSAAPTASTRAWSAALPPDGRSRAGPDRPLHRDRLVAFDAEVVGSF
jgi:hypothetical protein